MTNSKPIILAKLQNSILKFIFYKYSVNMIYSLIFYNFVTRFTHAFCLPAYISLHSEISRFSCCPGDGDGDGAGHA